MDWSLYDKDLHHERVKTNHREVPKAFPKNPAKFTAKSV